jgi:hypothetical protein
MRKLERIIDVAFVGLFTLAFAYAVVMLATGQFHISHTGMG